MENLTGARHGGKHFIEYLYFTDEETEVQRGSVTHPRLHSEEAERPLSSHCVE